MLCKNKCGNETIHGRQICEECDKKDRELVSQLKNFGEGEAGTGYALLYDVCHWDDEWGNDNIDCDSREYETTCGHNFYFDNGDVMSNEFKYCPWCGKHITITVELGDTL